MVVEYKLSVKVDGEQVYVVTRYSTAEIEQMFDRAEYAAEKAIEEANV